MGRPVDSLANRVCVCAYVCVCVRACVCVRVRVRCAIGMYVHAHARSTVCTRAQVGDAREKERLVICEGVAAVMKKGMFLLGITPLDKI